MVGILLRELDLEFSLKGNERDGFHLVLKTPGTTMDIEGAAPRDVIPAFNFLRDCIAALYLPKIPPEAGP